MAPDLTQLDAELNAAKANLAKKEEDYLRAKSERDEAAEIVSGYEHFLQLRSKLFAKDAEQEVPLKSKDADLLLKLHTPSHRNGIPYNNEFTNWSMTIQEPLTVPAFKAYLESKYPNSEVNPLSVRNPFRKALEDDFIIEVKKGAGRSAAIYAVNPKHS